MQEVRRWIANDGAMFDTPEAAMSRDSLIEEVAAVMAPLKSYPTSIPHGMFIRHDPSVVDAVSLKILRMAEPYCTNVSWVSDTIAGIEGRRPDGKRVHHSWASRIIGETAPGPIDRAWSRLSRIDQAGREWDQWYYLDHPHEGRGEWDGKPKD